MARFGICYLPKWVVIHNPRLFLLYWFLVLFLWIVAIWRFVELEQWAIQSPANGVVSMLPFASGLSLAETSAAMEADRSKDFCTQPSLFEYNYSDPSHPDSKSFQYSNIQCTRLCDDVSAVGQACINEAELTMDSATGTFIPTFFSDMTTTGFGSPSPSSHYFVPGIAALKLAFSHNYFVHRPADLLSGARETLHGSSDGAAGSGKAVVTVVLNHSGSILKRFEPGEPVELTVAEVLTAAKTDEFGDSDSRLLLNNRYSNFDERIMLMDSPFGLQGPPLRLTGADLKLKLSFTNKGYCQMDLDSDRVYVSTKDADVACLTVRAKRDWTQKVRSAVSTQGSWTRTYHGLKISFDTTGQFASFDTFALFESVTIVFIWLQVPSFVIYLMVTFMLGTLSRVYSSVLHQKGGLIDSTAGIAARLMNYSSTFKDLQDDKGDVTKQRMLRRFNYILAYEDDLDANEREKYVDFVYKTVLKDGEGRSKQRCEMLEFCSACSSGEPLSFEVLQKFFNRRRRAGVAERLFQDSSVSAIHTITDSQLDLKVSEEGDDEPLKAAMAADAASLRRSHLGDEYMKSGSRLTDILLENDNLQSRCADVTESLEETLKVAASVIADGAEEGTRADIYREEVRRIGQSTKMTPQLLADGSVYAGEWVGAVRHGRGVLTRPDGSSYSGQFEYGVVHGYATWILPTGAKYEGQWKNGKQDGEEHTIRLHKRFGTDTAFQAGNIKDAIERGRNYFGKGTSADDDKALQGMSRTALNQVQNSSQKERMSKHKARESKPPSVSDFEAVSEELYLASARYTTKGVKITESFEGHEAVDRARAALKKDLNVLQEDESSTANDTENSQALGNHELFELGSPSGALVGFSVRGQISNAVMQLRVNMKFGPLDSPTKTIDLLNLVDHLRVVLAAIPFVSQASKQKAIDSMTSTNIETQIPATDVKASLPLENGWLAYGHGFGSPFYRLKDGICSIQGLISGGTWGRLGTLPAECRPGKKMIFSALVHGASARLDVTAEGRVNWAGGSSSSWITLSNTLFVPGSTGWPVPLVNGWAAYGGAFGVPSYTVKGPICIVGGLVSGGTWGHIATLPEECRPVSTQLFNANNHDRVTRLDVTPAGAISYIDGGAEYGWVSFSGIIFTTDATAQSALPVASGWTSGGGWPGPTYAVAEGLCILEGLVWGLNWGHAITYLPVECWPMQTLIFGANNGAGVIQRIDVESDGTVKHVSEGATPANGWLSLAGIAFAKETSGERKMPLRNGWVTWGDAFGDATMNMKNGLCFMEAIVLSGSTWDVLAQLPEGCRPTKRLIFTANGHDDQFRVDVTTSGVITIVTGTNPSGWLSLSNIIFAPDSMGHIALPLVNGWTAYGGDYGTPDYTVRNGMCSLEGLLYKSGSSPNQQLALLPEDCRPGSGVLIFQTDNHGATARVDVYTTGEVYWIAGGAQEWVSLSGIVFATGNGGAIAYPLALQNGWGIYGDGSWFAPPQYFLSDGICSLQGLISGGTWTTFLTLPSDCRPNKVVIFDLNQHDANMRVDVYPTGEVNYITGSTAHGWVSLSGIIFEAV